jgi:NTE family protein
MNRSFNFASTRRTAPGKLPANSQLATHTLTVCRASLITLTLFIAVPVAGALEDASLEPARPRIGLVLGGGGAKGIAHVGVLRVLDELRIPIDCVAGTSMGALIGGTFAAGMPPEDIERETLGIDWTETVGGKGTRDQTPINRKLAHRTYANSLEIGIKDGRVKSASGLLNTQDIEDVIRGLVSDARFQRDFDDLPIPFRAVATDMISGQMVVMGSGDISIAMRASMALPGAFSPVIIDDQVLSDGGMMRNLPIDIARDLCADVVIAVWLSSPPPKPADLVLPVSILSRSSDVMIEANENAQIATLTDRDVGINVPMGDITTADFGRAQDAMILGQAAAEAVADQLRRYSVPESEYQAWRASVSNHPDDSVRLTDVRVVGLDRVNLEYVTAQLRNVKAGAIVNRDEIVADTNRIFALGDFERVSYTLTGSPDAPVLEIHPVEKSWGPNFFRGNLGLAGETSGELMALLRVDHELAWLNPLGGRWHNAIQVGRQTILMTDFYQPLDVRQRFFVQPILKYENNLEDVYVDGQREARYFLRETYGEIGLGVNISTRAQLRTGVRVGWIETKQDIGLTLLPELDNERESNLFIGGIYDTRDNVGLPTQGAYANLNYENSGSWLRGEQDYSIAEGVITQAFPLRGNSLNLIAAAGAELSGSLPPTRDFRIGGIRSFPGLQINELRGTSYWVAGTNYRQKVADILTLFDQAFYAGVRLQAGRVGNRRDQIQSGTLYGISGNLSGRTPVGAFILSLGYVDNESWALQFAIGAPLPEGSVLDQTN